MFEALGVLPVCLFVCLSARCLTGLTLEELDFSFFGILDEALTQKAVKRSLYIMNME